MNLKKIRDSRELLILILDSKYPRADCLGTKAGHEPKQQIPTKDEAVDYCKRTDVPRYISYKRGVPSVHTPHYTGVYYCPYCDCWHTTTQNNKTLKENTKNNILDAARLGLPMTNFPEKDYQYCVLLSFPDYTDEQIQEYIAKHPWMNK